MDYILENINEIKLGTQKDNKTKLKKKNNHINEKSSLKFMIL